MILWKYIRDRMMSHSAQKVSEKNASITYEELVIFAEETATKLVGEKICAIYCHSELLTAMALLSCFAAGVTAVPLSERYGEAHRNKILDACTPSCMMTDVNGELEIYHISDLDNTVLKIRPTAIMWTSGTTGKPKGAMLGDYNLLTNVLDIATYFPIDETDTILISRPLYHCAVLTGELLVSLIKGSRIIFYSEEFSPGPIISLLQEQGVTVFGGTPTLLNLLSRFVRDKDLTLKYIVISGECMSTTIGLKLRKTFPQANIFHVYGLTEAGPRVSYLPPEYFDDAPDCVGIPLTSIKIEIRNEAGDPLPPGEKGRLWVRGKSVMQGYYLAPEETRMVLQNGWLNTGDLAMITEKGWLKILGRADDLIIRAGMNIYPQEIEMELRKDRRTKDVLAYGYTDPKYGVQIGLTVAGDYINVNEVWELCKQALPPFQMPTKINLVDDLPRNGSGKIIRGDSTNGI